MDMRTVDFSRNHFFFLNTQFGVIPYEFQTQAGNMTPDLYIKSESDQNIMIVWLLLIPNRRNRLFLIRFYCLFFFIAVYVQMVFLSWMVFWGECVMSNAQLNKQTLKYIHMYTECKEHVVYASWLNFWLTRFNCLLLARAYWDVLIQYLNKDTSAAGSVLMIRC